MQKRSNLKVVISLIALVKSMLLIMLGAIILGVIGYLAAIFLTVIAGEIMIKVIKHETFTSLLYLLIACGILRGFLRYGEQWCNHFIAFKLLAMIRDIVFAKLRKLAPAKLDGKDQGNLVAMITSDVELLEVFYDCFNCFDYYDYLYWILSFCFRSFSKHCLPIYWCNYSFNCW